jgi:hypothetical protein
MGQFQKANWLRTASSEHARVYAPSGIPNTAINFGQQANITITVPWQFQGNGQVEVSLPAGTVLNAALTIGQATILAPTGTSYASPGGSTSHPRVNFQVMNTSNATNYTPANTDVCIVQY